MLPSQKELEPPYVGCYEVQGEGWGVELFILSCAYDRRGLDFFLSENVPRPYFRKLCKRFPWAAVR
jgi:hypothetical protein